MLTPGNAKLGTDLIWGFGLPSGGAACTGMTKTCRAACYAVRTEQYRPAAAARYRANLALAKTKGFARRVRAFLIAHHVRVVRVHTGGEFFSARYVRKWVAIAERARRVRFFAYTRAWRSPRIRAELDRLAELPNVRLWFSADRETGLPDAVPPRVRVAWLMTGEDDPPPAGAGIGLVFRVHRLRRTSATAVNGVPVCPAEAGHRGPQQTCDRCGLCWKTPASGPESGPSPRRRLALPLLTP